MSAPRLLLQAGSLLCAERLFEQKARRVASVAATKLQTNQSRYNETFNDMSIAYASRVFEFSNVDSLPNYAAEISPRCLNAISHLRLNFDIDIEPFANPPIEFHDERGSSAFFYPWWRFWEIVAEMRGLEEIQVHIGNISLHFDAIEEGDEARILGPLCAVTQTRRFNVTVEWRLLGAETWRSNKPFRITDLDQL